MTTLCLIYFYFLFFVCEAQIFDDWEFPIEYQTHPSDMILEAKHSGLHKPEIVRYHSGHDVILNCSKPHCEHQRHKVIWDFKPCKGDFKNIPCEKLHKVAYDNSLGSNGHTWKTIQHNKIRKCHHQLELKNINETNNGLYRCLFSGKTIKTFEVQVIDKDSYSGVPEIELIPSNFTVPINSQVIIQCKVCSEHRPSIYWFKQSNGSQYDIQYADKFYSKINTSINIYHVPNENNVYLSKLNIQSVSVNDSGVYYCVGVTHRGANIKDAFIRVLGNTNNYEPRMSFSLLFLIPLAFALVPITVWLCYYRKKKKDVKLNNLLQQKKLINSQVRARRHGIFSNKIVNIQNNKNVGRTSPEYLNTLQINGHQSVI